MVKNNKLYCGIAIGLLAATGAIILARKMCDTFQIMGVYMDEAQKEEDYGKSYTERTNRLSANMADEEIAPEGA